VGQERGARLPAGLLELLPPELTAKPRIYGKDLALDVKAAVWDYFLDALGPLTLAGKMGGVLLQNPRWFLPTPENKHEIKEAAERLRGIPAAVEFRNEFWYSSDKATQWTLDMLRDLSLTHVIVDGPQGMKSSVPAVPASEADRTVVLANNCYSNYGATNARELIAQLASL